ncbi:MAG: Bug family tripartite tricarboxylate transporter substrate binding protein, partial [Burkholderiaceae bacterium]
SAVAQVRAGKLRGLAISGDAREAQAPDVPTFSELGHESLSADSWIGLYAPAKTPMPIVRRWSDELGRAIAQKDVREKLEAAGFEVWFKPVDEFEKFHRSELGRWKGMVETAGVKLD